METDPQHKSWQKILIVATRAHARSDKASIIDGYLGSSAKFAEAVAQFAIAYAEQNEKDYTALRNAVRTGKIEAVFEE